MLLNSSHFCRIFVRTLIPVCVFFYAWLSASWGHALGIRVDRVTVNTPVADAGAWVSVVFASPFGNVPVVIVSPTVSNTDPATVRIRNVTTTGFEALLVEPSGSDGATSAMTVDYFAAEPGTYTFPGSVRMEVATLTTAVQQGSNISGAGWEDITFNQTFTNPAVITQVQTINSQPAMSPGSVAIPWLEVAVQAVSNTGMEIALERAETSSGTVVAETIGYVVMSSGEEAGLSGESFQALATPTNIVGWDNGCTTNNFASAFSAQPLAVASQNSRNGNNGGWARRCALSSSGIGLLIDEDVDADTDRSHIDEDVGVLAISNPFFGQRNGRNVSAGQFTIGAATSQSAWTSISFTDALDDIPHVFVLNTDDEANPAQVRVRNASAAGFELAIVKPEGEFGAAVPSIVDYVAVVPGQYVLPNGDLFEVGSIQTSAAQGTAGNGNWQTLTFSSTFASPPALLTQVQSTNNEPGITPNSVSVPWLTTAAQNLQADSVELALETAQTSGGTITALETIAYFAVNDGANGQLESDAGSDVDYEMFLSADNIVGWDDSCVTSAFADTYANPLVIASQVSRDGGDGGWIRRCSLSSGSVGLVVDEDGSLDSERSHTSERAGIFVFDGPFTAALDVMDHYAIEHGGNALTCEAETVRILPHTPGDDVLAGYTGSVRLSVTSTTAGWSASDVSWALKSGSGSLTFPNPGEAEYNFDSSDAGVELWLSNRSAAVLNINAQDVADSSIVEKNTEDPLLTFSDTGFRFYADVDGDGNADGTAPIVSVRTAGDVNANTVLRAVETSTETGACIGRTLGARTVSLAYECVNPASCIRDRDASINGTAIEENASASVIDFTPVSLTFDAQGEAVLALQYFDVGQIRLHAQLDLPASVSEAAFTLLGNSALTTVKPADLRIIAVEDATSSANPGTTSTGQGFTAGGAAFTVRVSVLGSTGVLTPNFGNESPAQGLDLQLDSLVFPSGGNLGSLFSSSNFVATMTAGIFGNTSVAWDQVGSMRLRTEIAGGQYLGQGNVVGTSSSTIGRFYPASIALNSATLAQGCPVGAFTYFSDAALTYSPIDIGLSLDALTARGTTPSNYDSALGYPVVGLNYVAENMNDGSALSSRLAVASSTWQSGSYTLTGGDNAGFTRLLNASGFEIPDGPFANLQLGLSLATSIDSVTLPATVLNMNASTSTDCTVDGSCNAVALGEINAVFGRLVTENTHGPETSDLDVLMQTEYWQGSDFVNNTADSCTSLDAGDILFAGQDVSDDTRRTVTVGSGQSTGSFVNYSAGNNMTFQNGDAGLVFSAPGVNNLGSFTLGIDLSNTPWLRFDWNQNNNHADDTAVPDATINFGRYRGHDRILFWREILSID